jgi:hypothetical protein
MKTNQNKELTFTEQAKYNRLEWLNIFVFTCIAVVFKWNIPELLLGAWVIFFTGSLSTLLFNFIKAPIKTKGFLDVFGTYILGPAVFMFLLFIPLMLIPLPELVFPLSVKNFTVFCIASFWPLILISLAESIYNVFFRKDRKKADHPLYGFVPLFIAGLLLFCLGRYVIKPNILVYFITFFILFLPFRDPDFEKNEKALDLYWTKKEEELKNDLEK